MYFSQSFAKSRLWSTDIQDGTIRKGVALERARAWLVCLASGMFLASYIVHVANTVAGLTLEDI